MFDDDDAPMTLWQLHLCSWIAFICLFCAVVRLFWLFGLFFCALVAWLATWTGRLWVLQSRQGRRPRQRLLGAGARYASPGYVVGLYLEVE